MYNLCVIRDVIRVPPKEFGSELKDAILKIAQSEYEGIVDDELGIVVTVKEVVSVGEGKVIPGDGSAYYLSELELLVFKPEIQEVISGKVSEITEFGAFVKIGPMEGLVHVSQIMDDYINYDSKNAWFVGRDSNKKLQVNDAVLARIITCSLKNSVQNSKIGMTMRQIGLGKEDWIEIDEKNRDKKPKNRTEPKAIPRSERKDKPEKQKR